MSKTQLTKTIQENCVWFKPELNTKMRTIRYGYEVLTPNGGYVDAIRFEDYIEKDNSYCLLMNPDYAKNDWEKIVVKEHNGNCKIIGNEYPNSSCNGCVFHHHSYAIGMLITCYEVKISVSDFHSKNGHNFFGNKNYYVVPKEIYNDIKDEVPDDVGIIIYYSDSCKMRVKKECAIKQVSDEDKIFLLYNTLKKWCDNKQ